MIIEANIKNINKLLKLILEFQTFDYPDLNTKETIDKISNNLIQEIKKNQTKILLYQQEDQIVGYATLIIYNSLTDAENQAYLDELFVSKNLQNQGTGSKFLNEIKNWCKTQHVSKLKLVTRPDNLRAQHFYEKNFGIKKDKVNYTFILD